MAKKIVVATIVAVMLVSCLFIFAGCVNGKYVNGDSYYELGAFGNGKSSIKVLGSTTTREFKYTTEKSDDGVVTVYEVVKDDDGKETKIPFGFINEDGNLVVGLITFTKK